MHYLEIVHFLLQFLSTYADHIYNNISYWELVVVINCVQQFWIILAYWQATRELEIGICWPKSEQVSDLLVIFIDIWERFISESCPSPAIFLQVRGNSLSENLRDLGPECLHVNCTVIRNTSNETVQEHCYSKQRKRQFWIKTGRKNCMYSVDKKADVFDETLKSIFNTVHSLLWNSLLLVVYSKDP